MNWHATWIPTRFIRGSTEVEPRMLFEIAYKKPVPNPLTDLGLSIQPQLA
jgi:hypothetical protein